MIKFSLFRRWMLAFAVALPLVNSIAYAQSPVRSTAVEVVLAESPKFNLSTIHVDRDGASFLFVGTRHTFDPLNPQIAGVEKLFKAFAPTLVLVEGGDWTIAPNKQEAVQRYSELGFTAYLAAMDKIKIQSADADFSTEIANGLKHHSAEDIRLYYALRYVPQWAKQTSALSIDQQMAQLLASPEFARHFPQQTRPRSIAELESLCAARLPGLNDWRTVQFDLSFHGIKQSLLTEIDRTVSVFRNDHMAQKLIKAVDQGERVFVIAGVTHLGKIVPQLQAKYFPPKPAPQNAVEQAGGK